MQVAGVPDPASRTRVEVTAEMLAVGPEHLHQICEMALAQEGKRGAGADVGAQRKAHTVL